MLDILENQSLREFNTLGFDVKARYFAMAASSSDVREALAFANQHQLGLIVLGGGSNMVLTADHPGLVIKLDICGKDAQVVDAERVRVRVGGGENWHGLVCWCLENSYYGIENLSLIPGSVGASPIQNIGAYGVELADFFHELEAIEVASGTARTFSRDACRFGYRDSIFKNELLDQYVVTHVTFDLCLQPRLNVAYRSLAAELASVPEAELDPQRVSETVCRIRSSKLPDPEQLGNVGSFFKNPVISQQQFTRLQVEHPALVGYPDGNAVIKVAAGWLIEACGWRGHRADDIGVYPHQALVLVNYGAGSSVAFMALAEDIRASVQSKFDIKLEIEPRIYPAPR